MEKNDILIIYGNRNLKEMTISLLEKAQLDALIGDKSKTIGLKPNLINSKAASFGSTTHPEIVEGCVQYLFDRGFKNVTIMEGSWIGGNTGEAFRVCGMKAVADKFGIKTIDTKKEKYSSHNCGGININICDCAANVDFMINMPVLKGHCQTDVTCALKNNKGVIPDIEKRRFHTMGLHKPIAHLNMRAKNDFILVDAICGDLDFEEGGNPVEMARIMAFRDPVLCDSYACDLIGYDVNEVEYIMLAQKLGIGSTDVSKANITELNEPVGISKTFVSTRKIDRLSKPVNAQDACSACYASLMYAMQRIDDRYGVNHVKEEICIGQAFKGKGGRLGVGQCTCGFDKFVKGCPPKAKDILDFLEKEAVR